MYICNDNFVTTTGQFTRNCATDPVKTFAMRKIAIRCIL